MEHLSDSDKAAFSEGMRAASTQAEDTFKVVAVLRALGDDIPSNVSINGADIMALVSDLEKKGIIIPGKPASDIEIRSLRGKVVDVMPRIEVRGVPYKGKAPAPTYNLDPDEALKMRAKVQEQMFLLELAKTGDSVEALEQRMEEAKDPLMRLVRNRQKK